MTESDNPKPAGGFTGNLTPSKMFAITAILGILLLSLIFLYFSQKNKMVEMETVLTEEKDSLANELKSMIHAYDTLRTNNDTPKAGLAKERERIVQLLSINASNAQLIKNISVKYPLCGR